MPKGPPVPIMGVSLRRIGEHAVVFVEFPDGREVEVIREFFDGPFSHNISEHGLSALRDKPA